MLDKMGKTDLGEAAKSLGIVFVIGIIVAVTGGMLTALVAEDDTAYGGEEGEEGGGDGTARQFIGIMHREGKSFVGLVAFWAPIAGLLMILSAGIILSLGARLGGGGWRGAAAARLAAAAAASAAAAGLLAARGIVGAETVAVLFAAALAADAATTLLSPRYPGSETNPCSRSGQGWAGRGSRGPCTGPRTPRHAPARRTFSRSTRTRCLPYWPRCTPRPRRRTRSATQGRGAGRRQRRHASTREDAAGLQSRHRPLHSPPTLFPFFSLCFSLLQKRAG